MKSEIHEYDHPDFSDVLCYRRSSRYMNSTAEMLSTSKTGSATDLQKNRVVKYFNRFSRLILNLMLMKHLRAESQPKTMCKRMTKILTTSRGKSVKVWCLSVLLEMHLLYLLWIHLSSSYHGEFIKQQTSCTIKSCSVSSLSSLFLMLKRLIHFLSAFFLAHMVYQFSVDSF